MKSFAFFLFFLLIFVSEWSFATWTMETINVNGRTRQYRLFIPNTYDADKTYSLIIGIHGLGSDPVNFSGGMSDFESIADTANIIMAYPQGLPFPIMGNAWNAGAGTLGVRPNTGIDDVGFINAVTDFLQASYPINKNKTYIYGFSNGGFMTHRMACESNSRYAAFSSIAGTIGTYLPKCKPGRFIPILHFHGTTDINVGYYINLFGLNVEDLMKEWSGLNQCSTAPPIKTNIPDIKSDGYTVEHYAYQACKAPLELFKINNALHVLLNKADNDISYSEEIWKFFNRFTLNERTDTITRLHSNFKKDDIQIYPNPVASELTINLQKIKNNGELSIRICDFTGQQILQQSASEYGFNKIDCSRFANGMYFIHISNQEKTYTEKILIQHE